MENPNIERAGWSDEDRPEKKEGWEDTLDDEPAWGDVEANKEASKNFRNAIYKKSHGENK